MQQQKRVRGDAASRGEGPLPDSTVAERQTGVPPAGSPGIPGSVAGVPSDQLWRAAVIAAREAALTAAELRRSLEAHRGGQ